MNAIVANELREELLEAEFEGETSSKWYYWVVYHRPAYEWNFKEQTTPALFAPAAANNRQIEYSNAWFRKLALSGGWMYIARYYWNGQIWVRDRCSMHDLKSSPLKIYSC
jgi:hypothetical protein